MALGNGRLAQEPGAIVQNRLQPDVFESCRIDASADGQNVGTDFDCLKKVARDAGESGQEKIAEAMPFELTGAGKPVLEELREQRFIRAESNQAVPDVSRWQHPKLIPQPARTAS